MIKPECPKCHSDKNVILMGIGFRCAFCGKRFFKGDCVEQGRAVQTKLNCNILEVR